MQAKAGQVKINFRGIITTAHMWSILFLLLFDHLEKPPEILHCKPGKPIYLIAAACPPSTWRRANSASGNFPNWLLSKLRNWIYNLLRNGIYNFILTFIFLLFLWKLLSLNYLVTHTLCCVLSRFSHVPLFVTSGTVTRQAPLSMGFSRQDNSRSRLPFPSPGDFPDPGIGPTSPASLPHCRRILYCWASGEAQLTP